MRSRARRARTRYGCAEPRSGSRTARVLDRRARPFIAHRDGLHGASAARGACRLNGRATVGGLIETLTDAVDRKSQTVLSFEGKRRDAFFLRLLLCVRRDLRDARGRSRTYPQKAVKVERAHRARTVDATFRAHGGFRGVTKKRTVANYVREGKYTTTLLFILKVQHDFRGARDTYRRQTRYRQHPALFPAAGTRANGGTFDPFGKPLGWFASAPFGILSCAFCATRNIWYACDDPRRDPSCCTS